jgi:hypothetical protein
MKLVSEGKEEGKRVTKREGSVEWNLAKDVFSVAQRFNCRAATQANQAKENERKAKDGSLPCPCPVVSYPVSMCFLCSAKK